MGVDIGSVNVLVPNQWGGLDVCDLTMLIEAIEDEDTEDLDAALEHSSFDMIDVREGRIMQDDAIEKVRTLNETDDAAAYWGMGSSKTSESG
jgi:hypothetical protein